MKYPTAPLLENVTAFFVAPLAVLLYAWYKARARRIKAEYAAAWQWNDDDCNVFFIAARKEDVDEQQEAELEEAYYLYVDMCRPFGIVPREFIDEGEE